VPRIGFDAIGVSFPNNTVNSMALLDLGCAQIVVRTDTSGGKANLATLSERIFADNLLSRDYTTQLIERISSATADAEALESETRAPESNARLRGATRPIRQRVPASAVNINTANTDVVEVCCRRE